MTKSTLLTLTTLTLLPVVAAAGLKLGQAAGYLKGGGTTPSHDFPVLAKSFDIEVSTPDAGGQRRVRVRVPVEAITTDNFMRDAHMRSAIFGAGLSKGIKEVEFVAQTAAPVVAGPLSLDGTLSINGVGKPHRLALEVAGEQVLRVQGQTTISLSAYGIDAPGMGPMKVADAVTLQLQLDVPRAQLEAGTPVARAAE
jgi:polyisoprenoid-binding protein YceI